MKHRLISIIEWISSLPSKSKASNHFLMGVYLSTVALFPTLSQAFILDVESALHDEKYRQKITPQFMALEELQIGGTHTYGAAAVILEDGKPTTRLDPKILIINPLKMAHDPKSPDVLSIVGNGFDAELLGKLKELCNLLKFEFKVVYVNNIEGTLSLPDAFDLARKRTYSPASVTMGAPTHEDEKEMNEALYRYVSLVKEKKTDNLYSLFQELMTDSGLLKVRLCEQASIADALTGIIDFYMDLDQEPFDAALASFKQQIGQKLKEVGSQFQFEKEWTESDSPSRESVNYLIQMQTLLLKLANFRNPEVTMERVRDGGYYKGINTVYSVVIKAYSAAL